MVVDHALGHPGGAAGIEDHDGVQLGGVPSPVQQKRIVSRAGQGIGNLDHRAVILALQVLHQLVRRVVHQQAAGLEGFKYLQDPLGGHGGVQRRGDQVGLDGAHDPLDGGDVPVHQNADRRPGRQEPGKTGAHPERGLLEVGIGDAGGIAGKGDPVREFLCRQLQLLGDGVQGHFIQPRSGLTADCTHNDSSLWRTCRPNLCRARDRDYCPISNRPGGKQNYPYDTIREGLCQG